MDFFGLPIGQIAFLGVEIDSDDMDLSFVQQVFLEIFLLLDLRHGGFLFIHFELKKINRLFRLDHCIDPTVVSHGFGFDIFAQQAEQSKENRLEGRFVFPVGRIGDPGVIAHPQVPQKIIPRNGFPEE